MGISTTIYGCIEEMDFWRDPVQTAVKAHNEKVIGLLPLADPCPPLSREMFSICHNSAWPDAGPNLEYSGRIIHFGANLKSVEEDWREWKQKFESLLGDLIWLNARVHFKTEYSELQTFYWHVDLDKYEVKHDGEMPVAVCKEHWEFEGPD